jgi:AcrR family transcriptional regulator
MRKTARQQRIEDREEEILDVARTLFLEKGYSGLNMDEIAERIGYSKGTVYGHFRNKEDILTEMAGRAVDKRAEMFARVAAFAGKSRERITALELAAELFVKLFPHFFSVEVIMRTETLREKAARERQEMLRACEARCMNTVAGIARDGISQGDLELPEDLAPEELTFGLWSLTYGGYSLVKTGTPLVDLGVRDPYRVINRNAQLMLDGIGWKPLSTEWDYQATAERAAEELFPQEIRAAQSAA